MQNSLDIVEVEDLVPVPGVGEGLGVLDEHQAVAPGVRWPVGEGPPEGHERGAGLQRPYMLPLPAPRAGDDCPPLCCAPGGKEGGEGRRGARLARGGRGPGRLEFSRQVGLSSRLTRPVPLISGATVAAGLGTLAIWLLSRRNRA